MIIECGKWNEDQKNSQHPNTFLKTNNHSLTNAK